MSPPSQYDLSDPKNPRHRMGTPGVPMIYQPAKLDRLYSDELAARLCREYTHECVDSLVEHMRDRSNPQTSLVATNAILDRGYGKPKELKALNGDGGQGDLPKYNVKIEFVDTLDHETIKRDRERAQAEMPVPEFKE